MNPSTFVPPGYENGVLWEWPDGQQLLGPRVVALELTEPLEGLSPYPLRMTVALNESRYVVTHLDIRAHEMAGEGVMLTHPPLIAQMMPSPGLPPISATGLAQIRLPALVQRALRGQCKVRYPGLDGGQVEGEPRADDLPAAYLIAQAAGLDPTKAVAETFGVTVGAAAQRVARARKAGQLPPTKQGAR